jgi:hypothetical protein
MFGPLGAASPLAEDVRGEAGKVGPSPLAGEGGPTEWGRVRGRRRATLERLKGRGGGRLRDPSSGGCAATFSRKGRRVRWAFTLGVQRVEPSDFNALNYLDQTYPHPSRPPAYCLHLRARGGRTYGDRCGFRGWSSGKRLAEVFGDSLRASRSGSLQHRTKPWRRRIGGRNRPGLKSPMRSRTRQRPARRGPPSERVKNPRSEGFRITAARSV